MKNSIAIICPDKNCYERTLNIFVKELAKKEENNDFKKLIIYWYIKNRYCSKYKWIINY